MSTSRLDRAALVWGVVFTMLGGVFLLEELGVWTVRADVFLPLLLIVAGAVLALTGATRREMT